MRLIVNRATHMSHVTHYESCDSLWVVQITVTICNSLCWCAHDESSDSLWVQQHTMSCATHYHYESCNSLWVVPLTMNRATHEQFTMTMSDSLCVERLTMSRVTHYDNVRFTLTMCGSLWQCATHYESYDSLVVRTALQHCLTSILVVATPTRLLLNQEMVFST